MAENLFADRLLSMPSNVVSNVTDRGRQLAIFEGMLHMQPDTNLIACVGKPWCDDDSAIEGNCTLCERWRFCGQSRQIVKLANMRS